MRKLATLFRLVLAHNTKHWVRTLLSVLGVGISVCLVIWIIRGYDAVQEEQSAVALQAAGRFHVAVTPPARPVFPGDSKGVKGGPPPARPSGQTPRFINREIIKEFHQDHRVSEVISVTRTRVRQIEPPSKFSMGPLSGSATLIGTDDPAPPSPVGQGRWIDPALDSTPDQYQGVVSAWFAEVNQVSLGQTITVGGNGSEQHLTVVGLLGGTPGSASRPMGGPMAPPHLGDIYVTHKAADKINGYQQRFNALVLVLNELEGAPDFYRDWLSRTTEDQLPMGLRLLQGEEDNPLEGRMLGLIKTQAHNATFLGFLAAAFIIFTTINASVRERLRQLAFMRSIAMTRSQLAAMILLESFMVAFLGWVAGLIMARLLLGVGNMLGTYLQFFQAGVFADRPITMHGILIGGASALAGCLAAAILPIWQAARLKPIDLLGGQEEPGVKKFPTAMVITGVVLILVNLAMVLLADHQPFKSLFGKAYTMSFGPPLLTSGMVLVGLILITPGFLRLIEIILGPVLAWMLQLSRSFFRQQLSANLWRNTGTTIALSAGLTIFVTSLVWGYSMLLPFTPDQSLPRMLVSILPAGVPDQGVDRVCGLDGVVPGQCLPMAVEQPRLADQSLNSPPFASVDPSQEHLLIMGVDTDQAFGGTDPLLDFQFIQGSREQAAQLMKKGRYCLVPDHFHTQTGLGVGDKFMVEVPEKPGQTVEYQIAGVVSIPGWNWFTKFTDIRKRAVRALAMVFADSTSVRSDFHLEGTSYFWMNVDKRVSAKEMEALLKPVGDSYANVIMDVPGAGLTRVDKQYIKITEKEELTSLLHQRADDVIWSLTRFPLLALVIASLAVFNAIFASVRSRYWQFGVLRGVGLSRWQLFRLVMGESLMLFLAAAILSLLSGTLLAWWGIKICSFFFFFAGRTPPLVFPWSGLSLGFIIAFALCFLAGLIPAWRLARREPLAIIQAGRVSM